jgi:hypothetical protein
LSLRLRCDNSNRGRRRICSAFWRGSWGNSSGATSFAGGFDPATSVGKRSGEFGVELDLFALDDCVMSQAVAFIDDVDVLSAASDAQRPERVPR